LACLAPAIQVVKEDRKMVSSGSHATHGNQTKPDTRQTLGAHIGGPLTLNVPHQLGLQKVRGKTKVNLNIVAN
jgi:hypothetical protein